MHGELSILLTMLIPQLACSGPTLKRISLSTGKKIVATNSELEYKVVRMCLDHIKTDPALIAQFHMHHTLDGTRLGYPWKEFKKLERRSAMLVAAGATELI